MKINAWGLAAACLAVLPWMAVEAAPPRITQGLVGEWKMQISGTTVPDTSGYGNHGSLYWYTGQRSSWGWQGDGVDLSGGAYIAVPTSPSLDFGSGSFGISAWIRRRDSIIKTIVDSRGSDGRGFYFAVDATADASARRLVLHVKDANGSYQFRSAEVSARPAMYRQWQHVMVEFFRTGPGAVTVIFSVDGFRVGHIESTNFNLGSISNVDRPFYIGTSNDNIWYGFDDRLDEVLVYNLNGYSPAGSNIPQNETAVGYATYAPGYWNDLSSRRYNNNCYNYANNKPTDTFAQPGRAAGAQYTALTCDAVRQAAIKDGLELVTDSHLAYTPKTVVALVVAPGYDYHWYRMGYHPGQTTPLWTHKPGGTAATDRDNSDNLITDPRTANRGPYTDFCGFFRVWSDSLQGGGHEYIN
ncbi:LamG-like jellyroll fold domain-containing protein [Corallococcus sp. M7]